MLGEYSWEVRVSSMIVTCFLSSFEFRIGFGGDIPPFSFVGGLGAGTMLKVAVCSVCRGPAGSEHSEQLRLAVTLSIKPIMYFFLSGRKSKFNIVHNSN